MDETKDIVEKLKFMDLAQKLGLALVVNPARKGGYVIFDDDPLAMVLKIDSGYWKIATGDVGVLNLPQEAVELMAQMSEMSKEEGNDEVD